MPANINELDLTDEPIDTIDYNAPESGSFPPKLKPGDYTFVFSLEDDPYSVVEVTVNGAKKKFLNVAYKATTTVTDPVTGDSKEVQLRFQRASFFKTEKMPNSMAGELIRAMGIHIEGALTAASIDAALKGIEGRGTFVGEVGWRYYCKNDDVTVSTHPRKKKGDVSWPRDADHSYSLFAPCPKCGKKAYGREEIVRFKSQQA